MTRDHLDDAIDAVAARLTHLREDDGLALRIVESLPERSQGLLVSWIPRLAFCVLALGVSLAVLRTFDDRSTDVLRTEVASAPLVESRVTAAEPPPIVRRTIGERSSDVRRTTVAADVPDHEFSLPAIDSPEALFVSVLASESLPGEEALSLPPLTIADLAVTAETISPR